MRVLSTRSAGFVKAPPKLLFHIRIKKRETLDFPSFIVFVLGVRKDARYTLPSSGVVGFITPKSPPEGISYIPPAILIRIIIDPRSEVVSSARHGIGYIT